MNRRHFLRSAGLISLSSLPPAVLSRAGAADALTKKKNGRSLVIVQLAGGNDGLNTVIPFSHDAYKKARPGIAIGKDAGLKLNDELSLHPSMPGMKQMFDDGTLSIVQGVGYPNPNRSHFASMDIWNSALPEVSVPDDGWMGRALDLNTPADAGSVPALALGTERLPLALVGSKINVPMVRNPGDYRLLDGIGGNSAQRKRIAAIRASFDSPANDELEFLRRTAASAVDSASRIEQVTKSYKPATEYPKTGLAGQLKTIAQLIAGDLGTRIFFVSLGGFDTHSKQGPAHAGLLAELSGAVSAFFKDLAGHGLDKEVMLATYSEFGRRFKENGSLGTDHGTASPLFLASPSLKRAGLANAHPSLSDLDDQGDLKFNTDFRSVYATLLENWLGFKAKPVLGVDFAKLDIF